MIGDSLSLYCRVSMINRISVTNVKRMKREVLSNLQFIYYQESL